MDNDELQVSFSCLLGGVVIMNNNYYRNSGCYWRANTRPLLLGRTRWTHLYTVNLTVVSSFPSDVDDRVR